MNEEYKRNLAVPFFTQRNNTYIWQKLDLLYYLPKMEGDATVRQNR